MYAEVQHVERLSPDLLRVVLGGGTLDQFEGVAATDAYINAKFLPAGSPVTVPFTKNDLADVDAALRPRPRRFTIRDWNPESQQLTIDFVAHGDAGYAGTWAQRAKPGDRLQFDGPGGSYRPSPDVDWHLMVGDESAIGAIGASLQSLADTDRALVFAIVEEPGYEIDLPEHAGIDVRWLYRSDSTGSESWVADAISETEFPSGTFDAFVHGEAAEVRAVRLHLASDRNVDVGAQSISPYWRRRHTDEDWRKVKRKWMADQARDLTGSGGGKLARVRSLAAR